MTQSVVAAGAVYIPDCALNTRGGQRRVCAADEDAVTLAVEAGSRVLGHQPVGLPAIETLVVALGDHQGGLDSGVAAQVVREALGLASAVRVMTVSGEDVLGGLAALQAGRDSTTLVIAAESGRTSSHSCGAALITIPSDIATAANVHLVEVARASGLTHERWIGSDSPGHGADVRFLEHRYRALASELVRDRHIADLTDVTRMYTAAATGAEISELRAALGGPDGSGVLTDHGVDRGVAGPLAAIIDAVMHRPPNGLGALYASGSGQAALLTVEVPDGAIGHYSWFEPALTRQPAPTAPEGPELSFPLESPFYVRNWAPMLRLEAAKCVACGYVAYPASQRPICPKCHAHEWILHTLARDGRVYASMHNRFLPVGFPRSLVFVLGELADGFKYWAPAPAETGGDELHIGDRVRLALRCFTTRNGITAYGMKFIPDEPQSSPAISATGANLVATAGGKGLGQS